MKINIFAESFIERAGFRYLLKEVYPNEPFPEVLESDKISEQLLKNEADLLVVFEDAELTDNFAEVGNRITNLACKMCLLVLNGFDFDKHKIFFENRENISIVLKISSEYEFRAALKSIISGNRYICSQVSNAMLAGTEKSKKKKSGRKLLTATETEILKHITLGKTTKEIAALRHVSVHTVMTHRKNIFRKIEVNTVYEARKYAMRAGIVELAEYYI